MNQLQTTWTGESPLICHNGQTADPRNSYAKAMKAVSSKRKKTDADYDEMARLEFLAGLYRTKTDIVIPDHVLEGVVNNAAKKSRRGPQAKSGIFITDHASLDFDGKPDEVTEETLHDLFEDGNHTLTVGVKVGTSRVMRTRPIFRRWSLSFNLHYDPDVLNLRDINEILTDAGRLVGLGDWRPKYGRFTVNVTSV